MPRLRKCKVCPEWHDLDEPWPVECLPDAVGKSSAFPRPYAVTDCMEPVQSQLDGKYYDSKSALRATYKAAGVVEVGNDPARLRKRPKTLPDKQGIRDSIKTAATKAGII